MAEIPYSMPISILCLFVAFTSALDCPQCIHITHRSYHGLIRSSLDRFYSPQCGFNNVTIGSQYTNARLVKCDRPGDKHEYKCGLIRGRASVKVDGQQQQDPDIPIELAIRMCIQLPEDNEDEFCEKDLGRQAEYLRQALKYYPDKIPITTSNVRAYEGETCFCSDNQCISGASSLRFTSVLLAAVSFTYGVIALWK